MLTRYGIERMLYRLAQISDGSRFVLKGAVLFYVWDGAPHRPTRDLDLLGQGIGTAEALIPIFRAACDVAVEPDGLVFDADSVATEPIRETQEYGGVRLTLLARLGAARIPLQVDIGFGDAITPAPEVIAFPTLLDFPAPHIRVYPPETVVAEKLQAMVALGMANSRMKDFYDLWTLAETREFDGGMLVQAIAATFARRGTPLPVDEPTALSVVFAADLDKQTQWRAFLRRSGFEDAPASLGQVTEQLGVFLIPLLQTARGSVPFGERWLPRSGWTEAD